MELGIVIRGTNENTLDNLEEILRKQKKDIEPLTVLNQEECFEEKVRRSFEVGLSFNKSFTLIIDGDILVCNHFLTLVRKFIKKSQKDELGFGLKIFDKFYHESKFRGIHVYNTKWLKDALKFIPGRDVNVLRPETFVKNKMKEKFNLKWNNDISDKVFGIHDFFQQPADIFYKFLIRAHRSSKDYKFLYDRFESKLNKDNDYYYALEGLKKGKRLNKIYNNKELVLQGEALDLFNKEKMCFNQYQVSFILLKQLILRYGLLNSFFRKIPFFSVLPY